MELSVFPFPYNLFSSFPCTSSFPPLLVLRFPRSPHLRSTSLQFRSLFSQKQCSQQWISLWLPESYRRAEAPSFYLSNSVPLSSGELSILPPQGVVTKTFCQCSSSKLSYGDLYSKIFHFMQSMLKNWHSSCQKPHDLHKWD